MNHKSVLLALVFVSKMVFGLNSPFPGESFKLTPEKIRFRYQPAESPSEYTCTHELKDALSQDWDVLCKDEQGKIQRKYRVHLWLTRYSHSSGERKSSYELLYWVDDRTNPNEIKSIGTTTWFHSKDVAPLLTLQSGLFVDNGYASLDLEVHP